MRQASLYLPFLGVRLVIATIVLIAATALVTLAPQSVQAQGTPGFNAGRIIDDGVFTNHTTMTTGNIQYFLNSKGVHCTNGEAACLKNYSENGRSAAQIIFDAAQEFQINPQVLIVVLQKEVGLVTANQPANWRYRTAMGYGCPDSTPGVCDSSYYGFTNQMRWAARMYRAIMNASPTWYTPYVVGNNYIQYNPNASCGGSNVYIQNRATQALYNYTPYQPNKSALDAGYGLGDSCGAYGNRNFYLYFRDWFGNPQQSPVVRTPGNPTYFLLTNNKKYAIASGDILYAYGLESAPVSVVSDAYLASFSDGGMLNTIYTNPGDGTVYLADGGKKYGIASGEYCARWGLACGNPDVQKVLGPEITNLMASGGMVEPIMKFAGKYYLMADGKKQPFASIQAMNERGFSTAGATPIVNWTNAIRAYGNFLPQNNSFVKFTAGSAIYFYSNNTFYGIPDLETYNNWLGTNGVAHTDSESIYNSTPPAIGGTLNNLVQSGATISLVARDKLYTLVGAAPSVAPLNITDNAPLSTYLANRIVVQVDSTKALGLANGTIFALQGNSLRPIPTMTDLRMSYSESNILSMPTSLLNAYPVGKLYMIPGRVFRPTDSGGAMYIYGGDKQLWALGSLTELYPSLKWNSDIVKTPFSNIDFTNIGIYANLAKINNTPYVVLPDGTLKIVPVGAIASHARVMPLDGDMTKTLRIDSAPIRFIRFDNGTIFRVDSTELRPISSLSTYLAQGGNASNTAAISLKALDTFVIGSPI